MLKVKLIVGSTRVGRNADKVLEWLVPQIRAQAGIDLEVLDLREWPLPFFQETLATIGNIQSPTYSDPLVTRWNQTIAEADAFVLLTPEYNHSFSAVLKNAIDSVFFSYGFRHKPVGFVGYSSGVAAGVRAVEQLNQVMLEAEAVPLRTQVLLPFIAAAFDATGKPTNPAFAVGLQVMLEDLIWLGNVLAKARAAGAPPPATLRIRAALTAPRG
ncbi:MAG TPA: NAD(P)H-dependent oxidoreductase [Polyangiaceae bacterium]|jgi:NAD(P)H-dependent FMN reductase|nr:NAD(P)H-dependent oxidoreductase [Polyangiaceae bacterium]